MDRNEKLAVEFGKDWKRVKARLLSARSVLARWISPHFKTYTFIEQDKALLSGDGKFVIVWKVREAPSRPESYENQQTSAGSCMVYECKLG